MAANQQVLKEYLLSLGFKIDQTSASKFDKALGRFDFNVAGLAKKVLGVASAAQVMVAVFANSMEKLYYASKRTQSTADNLLALDFAGKNVGVDSMRVSVEALAHALRTNPGFTGLLNDLGVKVEGRDRSDVLLDMVDALKSMPFEVASQYASMFGISSDDLLMMIQGNEEMKKARDLRKQMAADSGLDMDKAAKAGKEYANVLKEIWERVGILKDTMAVGLLPYFKDFASVVNQVLIDWTRIMQTFDASTASGIGKMTSNWFFTGKPLGDRVTLTPEAAARVAAGATGAARPERSAGKGTGAGMSLFERLEKQYGLPDGLLDKMWLKESGRGKNMLSPAGAQGHFQFMPHTQKEMGLKNPSDLAESAEKASQLLAMLMNRYGGDIQKALAAYNWGMGNVDRKGMANAPWETRDYVSTLSGRPMTINQQTTINVTSGDPMAAGRAVAREQDRVNATITRNQWGAVDTP